MTLKPRSLVAAALVLALAEGPAPLHAAPAAGRIAVAVGEVSLPAGLLDQGMKLRTELANSFRRTERVRLVVRKDIEQWRDRRGETAKEPDRAQEELSYARELLTQGKRDYGDLRFPEAMRGLEEARRLLILNLPALRSNRDLLDAHLYLGMAYAVLKQEDKAREEFRRAVYLDPKRELDKRDYSPSMIRLFAEVKREVMKEDPVRVRVESNEPGAAVYLNGRASGAAPLEWKLQPGEYFLLVEKQGFRPWYKLLPFHRRLENVNADLAPEAADLAWTQFFRVREGADQQGAEVNTLREFGEAVGANLVFLGDLRQEGDYRLLGQLYDVRTAEFSQVAVVSVGPDLESFPSDAESLVETLMGFVRPDGYLAASEKADLGYAPEDLTVGGADRPTPAVAQAPAPKKKWYQHWWVWPLVAGAAVGLGFGIAAMAGSESSGGITIDNRGNF